MIGALARWFYQLLGEGGDAFADMGTWDRQGMPLRSAAELVQGLETTRQGMQAAIASWPQANWQQTYPGEERDESVPISRHWGIWHLNEHDRYQGGEIGITLGMDRLPPPDCKS
ncbi:MAG: hypothetical protein CYG59_23935 [Chloroflexi bacterium]|nr:MAG: hypothetical protein CYG59_23935 [Chloroflexota bacterium]